MNSLPHIYTTTPFLGREREVTELTNLLQKPTCRLVTLAGPGGIGKTRLATEVAHKLAQHYHDGVYFVDLQSVRKVEYLLPTVVDVVAPQLRSQSDVRDALFRHLKSKHILLVLDNFEDLLPGGMILSELLANTSQVNLLVTSREVLKLRDEWLYPLEGLEVPGDVDTHAPETYSAVQLFALYAQRTQHTFDAAREAPHIVRICQLVGGMPLALEIAASWLNALPCEAIPTEIQRSLDFLTAQLQDVPERHRSIQAIFSHTWQLLSDPERHGLAALSVFQRGFEREGASHVAGASLLILSELVRKSLLYHDQNGRYHLHELVRQFAESRLQEDREQYKLTKDLHSEYYMTFLHARAEAITGPQQTIVLREIAGEIENIRAAWEHIVEYGCLEHNQRAYYTLVQFLDLQGRYREAIRVLETTITRLEQIPSSPDRDQFLTMALTVVGGDYVRTGRYDDARDALEHAVTLLQESETTPPKGFGTDPVAGLALLEMVLGNYTVAVNLAQQASARCEADDDPLNAQIAYYVLTNAHAMQGDYATAQTHASRAFVLTEHTSNRWMMAYVLMLMGDIERALKHHDQAHRHYQAGCDIKRELDDPEGVAFAHQRLGRVAHLQHDYDKAQHLYAQSLALYQDIHDPGGLATTLNSVADTTWCQGHAQQAVQYYYDALQIALKIQWVPLILSILTSIQHVICCRQPERAVETLTYIRHTATEYETCESAGLLLDTLRDELPAAQFEMAAEQAPLTHDVLAVGHEMLAELSVLRNNPELLEMATTTHPHNAANDALIDPLTDRELEVLASMAQGLTNRQIAEQLVVVLGTVKAHSHSIYSKLGVNNRVQAIKRAEELQIL